MNFRIKDEYDLLRDHQYHEGLYQGRALNSECLVDENQKFYGEFHRSPMIFNIDRNPEKELEVIEWTDKILQM